MAATKKTKKTANRSSPRTSGKARSSRTAAKPSAPRAKAPARASTAPPAKAGKAGGAKSKGQARKKAETGKALGKAAAAQAKRKPPLVKPAVAASKRPAQAVAQAGARPAHRAAESKARALALLKKQKAQAEKDKALLKKQKDQEKLAKLQAEKDKALLKKQKDQAEKDKALLKKQKDQEKLAKLQAEKDKALLKKQKDQEKLAKLQAEKQREKERLQAEREKAQAKKQQDREKERLQKEKDRIQKEKDAEKERLQKEKDRIQKEKDREKERLQKEKDAEKERLRKEKDRIQKEKDREKERLRKEKEREAYRRARETEREKVRTEKESARRALEGRVAQQAKEAQRISGQSRSGSTRVYRPDAIPSQEGTTREGTLPRPVHRAAPVRSPVRPSTPPAMPKPIALGTADARWAAIRTRIAAMPEHFRREYTESFDMSWIHHDSALEGVVYTYQELKTAVDPNIVIVPDSGLQPVCEEIRRHKQALEWARELGENEVPLTAEVLKKLYLVLHPEEGDLKSVKYRKEIPQHRLYFHEYAAPDKIGVRIRQAFEWLHGPEPGKLKEPVRVAARLHFDLLRTFPFPDDSGKVARLLMNILLMRAKLPPVIIHSTERQRYYDALRGSLPTIVSMINDSMKNSLMSIEKILDEEALQPGA